MKAEDYKFKEETMSYKNVVNAPCPKGKGFYYKFKKGGGLWHTVNMGKRVIVVAIVKTK